MRSRSGPALDLSVRQIFYKLVNCPRFVRINKISDLVTQQNNVLYDLESQDIFCIRGSRHFSRQNTVERRSGLGRQLSSLAPNTFTALLETEHWEFRFCNSGFHLR